MATEGAERVGNSELKAQTTALLQFCRPRGWNLVRVVHDVMPSRSSRRSRPSLGYALERLESGDASCLMVTELWRLCRSVAELGNIVDSLARVDARLVSLQPEIDTGTPTGRATAHTLAELSRWERAQRAECSRNALEVARAKGAVPAAIPADLKRHIRRKHRAGMTLQAIADELNDAAVPTVRGGAKWRPSSVQAAVGYKRPAGTHAERKARG